MNTKTYNLFLVVFLMFCSIGLMGQKTLTSFKKGQNALNQEKFQEAIGHFSTWINQHPKDYDALYLRAICYESIDRFDLAIDDNVRILAHERTALNLGQIGYEYLQLRKFSEAKTYLLEALALDSTSAIQNCQMSYIMRQNGEPNAGLKYCDRAIRIKPGYDFAYEEKVYCLYDASRYSEAQQVLDEYKKIGPLTSELLSLQAFVYFDQDQFEEARNFYSQALELKPNNLLWMNMLAMCLNRLARYEEEYPIRTRILNQLESQGKSNKLQLSDAYLQLGFVQFNIKEYLNSVSSYDKSLVFDPNNAVVYYFRSLPKALLGKLEDACNDFSKAKVLLPEKIAMMEEQIASHEDLAAFMEYCMPDLEN